jgi:hypothetical protein
MKSLMVRLLLILASGTLTVLPTTATGGERTKPTAKSRGVDENPKAVSPGGDDERSISKGGKDMTQNRTVVGVLDTDKPDTWQPTTTAAQKHLLTITQELIAIAGDDAQPVDARRKAIFQLGKIDSKSALEFLIKNIALRMPMQVEMGDEDRLKSTPCRYALFVSRNWQVGQVILESLDVAKSPHERIYLAFILDTCLGKRVALAAVEEHLLRSPRPISNERRENLEAIQRHLRGS